MPSDDPISTEFLRRRLESLTQQADESRLPKSLPTRFSLTDTPSLPNSATMDIQAERDLTDAKIAAAEARTDTKLARMDGKLDQLLSEMRGVRLDTKNSRNVVSTTVIGTAVALAALIYALFSYGASQFYNGTVLRDLVHQEAVERTLPPIQPAK